MAISTPSPQQREQLCTRGYYIARALLTTNQTEAIRAGLLARCQEMAEAGRYAGDPILEGVAKTNPDAVPLHERFRKLNQLDQIPALWDNWYAGEAMLAHLTSLLGPDVLNKYCSAFMKPARIGGPTPWHQDIGLWRDDNVDAVNAWLAIDPATKVNGCLQMVPGSHLGPVVPHVSYDDSIHAELPRDQCADLAVEHIELAPGDAVIWHSNMWHYSPPNTSDQGRIGVGAVWVNPAQISQLRTVKVLRWAQRHGERCPHPAARLIIEDQVAAAVATVGAH
ncbi:MAG: phytanoyl-CoA dioxygenase family protein [Planctomycetota bacterium]|jgi:phytanoyl-CoA hydroxylase|nr:phytanoyl-CoA dioxygenase family protein [Planctomycetota bacterium]